MRKNKKNKHLYLDLRPRGEGLGSVKKCRRRNADSDLRRLGLLRTVLGVLACAALCFGAYFAITMYIVPTAKNLVPTQNASASPSPLPSEGSSSSGQEAEVSGAESLSVPVAYDKDTGLPIYDNSEVMFVVNYQNEIPRDYKADIVTAQGISVDSKITDALAAMTKAAEKDKITLTFVSGYVSSEQQQKLYDQKVQDMIKLDGYTKIMAKAKAKDFVPLPGFADTQTGLCVTVKGSSKDFEKTDTYLWLNNFAADYGFIFRYPTDKKTNTGVEPDLRVLRYVGTENAIKMRQLTMCLEEYSAYLQSR